MRFRSHSASLRGALATKTTPSLRGALATKIAPSLRGVLATKQSILKILCLDCFVALLLAMTIAFPAYADFKVDQKLPIQIQSDKASFERLNRQAIHEGNVIMVQGNQTVYADRLIAKKDSFGKDTLINAMGNPAIFIGKVENEPEPLRATAKVIHYHPDKQLIILEGDAQITHLQDKFQGPMLSYQLDKQIVTAAKQSKERPTITIQPRPIKKS